jgi:hypothetical protein
VGSKQRASKESINNMTVLGPSISNQGGRKRNFIAAVLDLVMYGISI